MVVNGDASQDEVLLEAGILEANSLASVLPTDAINVFITLSARDMNPNLEIIARAECPSTEHKLRRSGAHHVIMPATIGAFRIAHIIANLESQQPLEQSALKSGHRLLTVPVTMHEGLEDGTLALAQQTLAEIGHIVGIQRADSGILTDLSAEVQLDPEDILLVTQAC